MTASDLEDLVTYDYSSISEALEHGAIKVGQVPKSLIGPTTDLLAAWKAFKPARKAFGKALDKLLAAEEAAEEAERGPA